VPFRYEVDSYFAPTTVLQRHNGSSWVNVTASASQASFLVTDAGNYRIVIVSSGNIYHHPFFAKAPPPTTFTPTVSSNNTSHGTVSTVPNNLTNINSGTLCTLTATPNTCYRFVNWTRKGTSTVVSTANPYVFAVSGNDSLVANFELLRYKIIASANAGGSATVGRIIIRPYKTTLQTVAIM